MGFLNKIFGFRWSLYIVREPGQLVYAMHENSAIRIAGYVMDYFQGGATPKPPWSLYLNFNHKQRAFRLEPSHFTADGENLTAELLGRIQALDPGWQVKGGEPVFEEAATKKQLPITEHKRGTIDIEAMIRNAGKPRETTFFSVMDQVFGR